MTRPRSNAPGGHRPARPRSFPRLLLPSLLVFLAAGCIGQNEARNEPSSTPGATVTAQAPSAEATVEPSAIAEPTPAATPAPTEQATPAPTTSPTTGPTPSGATGSVDACTGTDDNRTFFTNVTTAFDWPVYCAVLPARWFVDGGRYRSAGGGWMQISYRGPGGARFELHEGAFCDQADGCVPAGTDAGSAAFGDQTGTFVTGDDGRYAVVVDRGAHRSWLAVGVDLDVETFKDFAAALVHVAD